MSNIPDHVQNRLNEILSDLPAPAYAVVRRKNDPVPGKEKAKFIQFCVRRGMDPDEAKALTDEAESRAHLAELMIQRQRGAA